jgi:ribonuclease D
MTVLWVEGDDALRDVLVKHQNAALVAVDTEFRRRDTFYPQVALLQLCWGGEAYLIDPLSLSDLSALRTLITNDRVLKVLHSPSEDLEVFDRWLGVLPQPMADTQRAAALVGLGSAIGYRALVEVLLGIALDKEETQSNWLARPLTQAQQAYAAADVTHLFDCWQLLNTRLLDHGRLDWVLADSAAMRPGARDVFQKHKSAWKLNDPQLSVLLALVAWREERAQRRDKPRTWILDDKGLMAIAKTLPETVAQLSRIEGLAPGLLRHQGEHLLSLVAASRKKAPSQRPPTPLSARQRGLAKALAEYRDEIAAGLVVAADVLCPNRDVEALARRVTEADADRGGAANDWRQNVIIEPLRARATQWLCEG